MSALTFKYELAEPGLAAATLTYGDTYAMFQLSNACNPLHDLLAALVGLIICPNHLWGKENKALVTWYGDEESYNWHLQMTVDADGNQQIELSLTQMCDFFGDEEIELVHVNCTLFEFLLPIISELDAFIKKLGLLNYHQQWQKDEFPATYFLFLKKYIMDAGKWVPKRSARGTCILRDEILLMMA